MELRVPVNDVIAALERTSTFGSSVPACNPENPDRVSARAYMTHLRLRRAPDPRIAEKSASRGAQKTLSRNQT